MTVRSRSCGCKARPSPKPLHLVSYVQGTLFYKCCGLFKCNSETVPNNPNLFILSLGLSPSSACWLGPVWNVSVSTAVWQWGESAGTSAPGRLAAVLNTFHLHWRWFWNGTTAVPRLMGRNSCFSNVVADGETCWWSLKCVSDYQMMFIIWWYMKPWPERGCTFFLLRLHETVLLILNTLGSTHIYLGHISIVICRI